MSVKNISDIAEALGVSKTTVSRAISGKGRIGEETRKRVLDYIEQHNFKLNAVAKGLAEQRTSNIAVMWPSDYAAVDLPFFQNCMIGIAGAASDKEYDILVLLMGDGDIHPLQRVVENHKVDGVILTRTMVKDISAEYLKSSGLPFVVIGGSEDPDVISIDNDNFNACRDLTERLIDQGLRKIALIGGDTRHMITGARCSGYKAAFADKGLEADPSLICLDTEYGSGTDTAISHILKKQAEAVICMDDRLAMDVQTYCAARKISIPGDLKLASFYHSSMLENSKPAVTSLAFDDKLLGEAAAKALLDLIAGNPVENRKIGGYRVLERESTLG